MRNKATRRFEPFSTSRSPSEEEEPRMASSAKFAFDPEAFNAKYGGVTVGEYKKNRAVFFQGNAAGDVFYIQEGKVQLAVLSEEGKERVVMILEAGDFCGEGCLAKELLRVSTATTLTDCKIVRLEKKTMARALHEDLAFSEFFVSYLLSRNARLTEDLVDQLFNSSERRLARALLLLAHFETNVREDVLLPTINQQTLAKMIGTTRSRVNFFMNKFRRLGFIDYNGRIKVYSSLLNVVLRGDSTSRTKHEVTPGRLPAP
jgi:CRP/FNR family transcriptional regulator, cyclic AMP receptor protein